MKKAEAELQAAVADLKRQEDEYQTKIKTLEKQSNDASGSMVCSRTRGRWGEEGVSERESTGTELRY